MNNTQKTILFFVLSIGLFLSFLPSGREISRWFIILSYLIYLIFCILNFKSIKIRFLAYPLFIINIFLGWYSYEIQGFLDVSNKVGFGYIGMWIFILIALPLMIIALIAGGIFDIIDLIKKNKNNGEKEEIE